MARGDSYQLQGQQGGVVVSASGSETGQFRWVQVVTDTVFSSFVSSNLTNASTNLITITIPAGIGIGGNITSVAVTSGTVIAYYA
jgi:predicted permease